MPAAKAERKVHISVILFVAYRLTAAHWSLHWCFQVKLHPVHIWFTPVVHDKQLHLLFISYCSLSPHLYKLHGSQSDLNCIKPAVPIVYTGNMGVENAVTKMADKCCQGNLWLVVPLAITLFWFLEEDLQLYSQLQAIGSGKNTCKNIRTYTVS